MKNIFIVTAGSVATGGPELCHQLGDALNRHSQRAWLVYTPFEVEHQTPPLFQRYQFDVAQRADVEPGSMVIVPEIYTELLDEFPGSEIHFWWQSVDNFFGRRATSITERLARRVIPDNAVTKLRLNKLRRRVDRHLYQSEYARQFLQAKGLAPASRLSDYLADEYTQPPPVPDQRRRDNVLVYNPAKGMKRTAQVLRALTEGSQAVPKVVALRGMNRDEIRGLFDGAKVYIDFGDHPGKDRIPREAASRGACVVTNRRGSAANQIDMPIPEQFKVDDTIPGFAQVAAELVRAIMADFHLQAREFDRYRQLIAQERANFFEEVGAAFPPEL